MKTAIIIIIVIRKKARYALYYHVFYKSAAVSFYHVCHGSPYVIDEYAQSSSAALMGVTHAVCSVNSWIMVSGMLPWRQVSVKWSCSRL